MRAQVALKRCRPLIRMPYTMLVYYRGMVPENVNTRLAELECQGWFVASFWAMFERWVAQGHNPYLSALVYHDQVTFLPHPAYARARDNTDLAYLAVAEATGAIHPFAPSFVASFWLEPTDYVPYRRPRRRRRYRFTRLWSRQEGLAHAG